MYTDSLTDAHRHHALVLYCTVLYIIWVKKTAWWWWWWCLSYTWRNWLTLVMTRVRLLRFGMHYKDTIQERLRMLMLFRSKFIRVCVRKLVFQNKQVWCYYKIKRCSFFDSLCTCSSFDVWFQFVYQDIMERFATCYVRTLKVVKSLSKWK